MKEIIAAVKQHALDNYNTSYGWSVVVECFTDEEIQQHLERMIEYAEEGTEMNVEFALQEFEEFAKLHTERYEEARAEIW